MTSFLVDTNILLRLAQPLDQEHNSVRTAVSKLLGEGAALFYTLQNIVEFWNVWTRPVDRKGFGLPHRAADDEVAKFDRTMVLVAENRATYKIWRYLVIEFRVSGAKVHDARLVAIMIANAILNILTLNGPDFARYDGRVKAVEPALFFT